MAAESFGGSWTEDKLRRLRGYLAAYTTIFNANERARKLTRIYVDAFAGSGYRRTRKQDGGEMTLFPEFLQADTREFRKGSARIALEVEPSFHQYVFIERSKRRAATLAGLKSAFPQKADRIKIVPEDANRYLQAWCRETDWRLTRAVVFLDPYGMQVEWATILAIANTKAIDLWMLFPLGSGVVRLLTRDRPPRDEWAQAITRILGTPDWQDVWYHPHGQQDLFGVQGAEHREVDWAGVSDFVIGRLRNIFVGVAGNPLVLRNSRNVPLYLLCFAASNEKGARPALRIAENILREVRRGRRERN